MAKKYCKSSELTNEDHLILSLSANILAGILANGNTCICNGIDGLDNTCEWAIFYAMRLINSYKVSIGKNEEIQIPLPYSDGNA